MVIDSENHKVVVKGKKADPLKALRRLRKKYSRNAELISPKPICHAEIRKEPEKKKEVGLISKNIYSTKLRLSLLVHLVNHDHFVIWFILYAG